MYNDRKIRILLHKKQPRVIVEHGFPQNSRGSDGDSGYFSKDGNVYLGIKFSGKWHFRRFLEAGDALNETV